MINLNPMGTRPNEGWHIPNVGEAAVRAAYQKWVVHSTKKMTNERSAAEKGAALTMASS